MLVLVPAAFRSVLSVAQRYALSQAGETVGLGQPAVFRDDASGLWFGYDDPRFRPLDAAVAATILGNLGAFPDFDPFAVPDVRAECLRFAQEHGLNEPEDGDSYWDALAANGAPETLRVEGALPEGWSVLGG